MTKDSLPVTTDGRLITDRLLYRGLTVNIIAGSLGMGWWAFTQGMPLTMLMEALGSSGALIGAAMMVMQLALIVQMPAAFYANRLPTRKRFWSVAIMLSRAVWFAPAAFLMLWPHRPLLIAAATIWIAAISAVLPQSVSALWYSWMADLVPDGMRGRFWGTRQSWTTASFVAAIALAGYILDVFPSPRETANGDWTGFMLVFAIGAGIGVMDIVVHLWVPEPKLQLQTETTNWIDRMVEPMRNADFRRLTIAMGIQAFSTGLISLGIVYLKKNFDVTYSHLSALIIASSFGTVLSSFVWGYLMDRIGGRAFGAAMLFVMPLPALAWFFVRNISVDFVGLFNGIKWLGPAVAGIVNLLPVFWGGWIHSHCLPQPVWILLFTSFLGGAIFGGIGLCQLNMIGSLSPAKSRTMAMAVHWTVVGAIGSLGVFIAGNVMDHFAAHPLNYTFPTGTKFAFQHALVTAHILLTWLVVLPALLRIRRRKGEPHFVLAITQLFVNNPLRSFASIYMVATAVSSRRRAQAARNLGRRRAVFAVSDMIQRLDDPSRDVREAAVFALGNIASPEAVAALAAKLHDPRTDLAPQIARALRITKDRAAVDPILLKLDDPDGETRGECIRALGEIGDSRAVPRLIELFSQSTDIRIVSASAEALGRLREVQAIYKIVPRMKNTDSVMLKHSLEVAVGDIMGERDEFYKVLIKEQQTGGSQAPRLLRRLRREIKRATRLESRAERTKMIEKTHKMEWSFDKGEFDACAELLLDLALDIAALLWKVERTADISGIVDEIAGHDKAFAAGVWYLDQLHHQWFVNNTDTRDGLDILLGVYFLASRRLEE